MMKRIWSGWNKAFLNTVYRVDLRTLRWRREVFPVVVAFHKWREVELGSNQLSPVVQIRAMMAEVVAVIINGDEVAPCMEEA